MEKMYEIIKKVKNDSFVLAALGADVRNKALDKVAQNLEKNTDKIVAANELDLAAGEKVKLSLPLMERLKFDKDKIDDTIQGLRDLMAMDDPLGKTLLKRDLDEGLRLEKVTCPIGVIGVIFESRPDALVQIAGLCLKSGNSVILKGGSEAANTNKVLFDLIHEAAVSAGLPEYFAVLIESRDDINELLKYDDCIDLIIPRGSNEFVQYIMAHSNIPVMGHSDGICHVYVDEGADVEKAIPIIIDSKTQYVAACNAVETLLVHSSIAEKLIPPLYQKMHTEGVELRGCPRTQEIIKMIPAENVDFSTEYLDYILSIKIVDDMDEAINHINELGSHHTDAIVTEDSEVAERFMSRVDSANVYQNCSTRFADGFRYGFGAEVGISTGKLHARGPVGLEGLLTYKYKIYGNGQLVDDYAKGKRSFNFKDIE